MKLILVTLQICLLFVMILVLAFDIVKMIEKYIDRKIEERINQFEQEKMIEQWEMSHKSKI